MSGSSVASSGLSPPVRGSRPLRVEVVIDVGSIPARAGEPGRPPRGADRPPVYPRPCGGAGDIQTLYTSGAGLSPPVRGSHSAVNDMADFMGSIPARAGEPAGPSCSP